MALVAEQTLDVHMVIGCSPDSGLPCGLLMEWQAMDIKKDSDCGRTMEPDTVLISNLGSDVTMAPCGSTSHPDWRGPSVAWLSDTSMVPGNGPDP